MGMEFPETARSGADDSYRAWLMPTVGVLYVTTRQA